MVTRNDIVYIDLGSEDQIKRGDYLTIYRPLGTGNITTVDDEETLADVLPVFKAIAFAVAAFQSKHHARKTQRVLSTPRSLSISTNNFQGS